MSAIAELATGPRTPEAVEEFFATHSFPIVEGTSITIVWRGEAQAVHLKHWVYGLPSSQSLERIEGTDVWHRTLQLPEGSRVEYKLEVVRDGNGHWIQDPLNPHQAMDPYGRNSVAHAKGYEVPEWTRRDEAAPRGRIESIHVDSKVFGRREHVDVYLPARLRPMRRYPLLIVHDAHDYLRYASLRAILDNLMDRLEIADTVVAFTNSPHRLVEYAADDRHASYLTDELVPHLERVFPLESRPQARCLMGASFGAVAALSTAWRRPGFYGRLLLQSGSFAFTDIGEGNHRGPRFDPIVTFMNQFRAQPTSVAERVFVSCGVYESLIYENRSLVPVLRATGMDVRYVEARDGHNWENWRDRLREGLSWLNPGTFMFVYD